uniref:Peptidase inhibitor 15a n=1 Tax=Sinocyclocheilus grahami TaxID=75366 RepID=A0A672L5I6_SINGR
MIGITRQRKSRACCKLTFVLLPDTSALAAFSPNASSSLPATNFTDIGSAPPKYLTEAANLPKTRRKRYISQNDMLALLDYHNKVRGKVFPPASNMEYMVSHMVWATSNKVGCAINTCHNMNVWGSVWKRATYLVCNYSPKGNWIGEAPYKVGVPCSMCPPSYGGSCSNNMCFPAVNSNYLHWFK